MERMRPRATVERTVVPWSMPGRWRSSTYRAVPRSLGRASLRGTLVPMGAVESAFAEKVVMGNLDQRIALRRGRDQAGGWSVRAATVVMLSPRVLHCSTVERGMRRLNLSSRAATYSTWVKLSQPGRFAADMVVVEAEGFVVEEGRGR